jgi:tetratricopeptide (TPR) repeat protein
MPERRPKNVPRKSSAPAAPSAGWKKWGMRSALVALPLVFLLVVELVLRLAGIGYPTRFLLGRSKGSTRSLVQNNQFGWRFFGAQMARVPAPISLVDPKPPGAIRIVVFGESAAFGDPQPRYGLPRMLEALLELRYPGIRFEVVNAAMTGINSHVVVRIARDCVAAGADVWVVYMGNNEVVGPFGAGTVFGRQVPPLPVIRAGLALKATRIGQEFDAFRRKFQKPAADKSEWGGMTMFVNNRVAYGDPRMESVYRNFQQNLADIIRAGHRSGAGVVLSTVAVNLKDCAPFASMHRANLSVTETKQWERLRQAGADAQETGNWAEAEKQFKAATGIDDRVADLHFRLGQSELAIGRLTDAENEFAAARDLDTLRFRCDGHLNDLIRQARTNQATPGVLLADAEYAAAAASPNGVPGAELFYEHVHLTFAGNYVVARAIAEQVEKLLRSKLPQAGGEWPKPVDCARRLAWTRRAQQLAMTEIQGRLTDPPFTLQSNHAAQEQRLAETASGLPAVDAPNTLREAQQACEAALASWPKDALLYHQLAELKQAGGDHAGAASAARQSLELLPTNKECWLLLGLALAKEQKYEEAAAAFGRVFELDPEDVWGRQNLAICWQKLGRRDEAIREFKQALEIKPRFGLAWLGLGQVYEEQGRKTDAEECYRLALLNRIHRADELTTLARFCQSRGWFDAAVTNYIDAISLNPSDFRLRLEMGQALSALGRHGQAAQAFGEATRLAPDQGQIHYLRGFELGRLGKPADAEQEFRAAAQLMPEVIEARLNLGIALYQQQKREEALATFEEVLQRSPTNALAQKYVRALSQ